MRAIERINRTSDHGAMYVVIRDTEQRHSEVWFFPADGREMQHVRTFEHARDAAQKAATLADKHNELSDEAWEAEVVR